MEKLNSREFESVLRDVRKSYRLIALYQKRVMDVVKYIGAAYNQNFESGWAKFSNASSNGNRANIDRLSWDWLSMYLYEFHMGQKVIGEDKYWFKIVHQADTGYFDTKENVQINKIAVDKFERSEDSKSRLFFVLSKNEGNCPIHHLLGPHLTSEVKGLVKNGNWIGVPYELSRFIDQKSTDQVLKEFNDIAYSEFQIELMPEVEVESEKV